MANLETYNRVPHLRSRLSRYLPRILTVCLLLTLAIGLSQSLPAPLLPWPTLPQQQAQLLSLIALALLLLVQILKLLVTPLCQYCGHALAPIVRPFLLTPRYLNMTGHKQGDYFFTQARRGYWSGKQHWIKISHQSLACHHCRLFEHRSRTHIEAANDDEIRRLQQTSLTSQQP